MSNQIKIFKLKFPHIFKILQEYGLEEETIDQMLRDIKAYEKYINNPEDYLNFKLILKEEKFENIDSRKKLFSFFPDFEKKLIELGIDDYTFKELENEFEFLKKKN